MSTKCEIADIPKMSESDTQLMLVMLMQRFNIDIFVFDCDSMPDMYEDGLPSLHVYRSHNMLIAETIHASKLN